MAYGVRQEVTITTDASGDAEVFLDGGTWVIEEIKYTKDDFADTVDFAITGEDSGTNIWTQVNITASVTVRPRAATHSTAGVAALYAASGTAVNDKILIIDERIKIVIDEGGNATSGTITVTLGAG